MMWLRMCSFPEDKIIWKKIYIRKNSQLTKERLDESSRKYAKAQGCRKNNKSSIYLCVIE